MDPQTESHRIHPQLEPLSWGIPFLFTHMFPLWALVSRLWNWMRLLERSLQRSPESLCQPTSHKDNSCFPDSPGHPLHKSGICGWWAERGALTGTRSLPGTGIQDKCCFQGVSRLRDSRRPPQPPLRLDRWSRDQRGGAGSPHGRQPWKLVPTLRAALQRAPRACQKGVLMQVGRKGPGGTDSGGPVWEPGESLRWVG